MTDRNDRETMKDVDHTPPNGEDAPTRLYERGNEYDTERDD
jgi:hypothetical protein